MSSLAEQKTRKELGLKIKELRKNSGQSQENFSESLKITSSYLGFIEQGIRSPSLSLLVKIAGKLNVEVWKLFK